MAVLLVARNSGICWIGDDVWGNCFITKRLFKLWNYGKKFKIYSGFKIGSFLPFASAATELL